MREHSKKPPFFYRAYATVYAIANYLRGESPLTPVYQSGARQRVRRSLFRLDEYFTNGWPNIERGEYAGALVVYAATIGEFHPLMPVIDSYLKRNTDTSLVIFSGQLQYVEAMGALYPDAAVGILPASAPWLYDELFKRLRPCAVVLGEGPCLYLHFPIPFDLALPMACLRYNTPLLVVNATLHALHVASTIHKLEKWAFGQSFMQSIRYWYTPNEVFKSWLLEAKVPGERIVVSGDLRFDDRRHLGAVSTELAEILNHLRSANAPVIVAGSVNAIDEEGAVVDGWLAVRERHNGARLIIAPRHVNNTKNMEALYQYLTDKGVRFARRSAGVDAVKKADVIVVDVFGELPHFYSVASIAYIGRNHSVLEPLRFLVPTVVAPIEDWAHGYVTFPAYKHMIDEGGIIETPSKKDLGVIFSRIIDDPDYGRKFVESAERTAKNERLSGEKIVQHMEDHVR